MSLRSIVLAMSLTAVALAAWTRPGPPSPNLDWRDGASSQAVDQRFAEAKSSAKPLLLYWGATWCPPATS